MRRRDFIATAVAAGAGAAAGHTQVGKGGTGMLLRRRYKEGTELSIIGFGGIVVSQIEQP